jgi:hypothetical protein
MRLTILILLQFTILHICRIFTISNFRPSPLQFPGFSGEGRNLDSGLSHSKRRQPHATPFPSSTRIRLTPPEAALPARAAGLPRRRQLRLLQPHRAAGYLIGGPQQIEIAEVTGIGCPTKGVGAQTAVRLKAALTLARKALQETEAELFKPAIQRSAEEIHLAHNHPSSDPSASPEDVAPTRMVA